MIMCPLCDNENIEGVDVCEQCGQPLDDAHLPDPKNAVERGLLVDTVDHLHPKTPIVVEHDTAIGDVLKLLVDRRIGCVFVVENDRAVGVFSERDALMRLNVDFASKKDQPVAEFMTSELQSLKADARIAFAVHQMDLGGYRHIPILDGEGRAKGVISVRDILRYLTERMAVRSGS